MSGKDYKDEYSDGIPIAFQARLAQFQMPS